MRSGRQRRDITETATPPGFTFSRLLAENCSSDKFVEFAGTAGQVTVLLAPVSMPVILCQWQISVPEDRYMIVIVESLMEDCVGFRLSASFTLPLDAGLVEYLSCSTLNFEPALFIPISNVVYFKIESPRPDARNPVTLRVSYTPRHQRTPHEETARCEDVTDLGIRHSAWL